MMIDVWLMRHGEAQPSSPSGDFDRSLTSRGRRDSLGVAAALKQLRLRPHALWCSPLARAEQTAAIVGDVLGVDTREVFDDLSPHGDPDVMARVISNTQHESLFVVSHLPLLPLLAVELLKTPLRLDIGTATVVHLSVMGSSGGYLLGLWSAEMLAALTTEKI